MDERGNPSCLAGCVRLVSSLNGSQWIATGISQCPRDDNTLFREHTEVLRYTTTVSLRGATNGRDAAIHRVSRDVVGFVRSVTGDQWIAAGLRPRDDKSVAFPFTLQSSLFLHWLFWKPTRKPRVELRVLGVLVPRPAERRAAPPLCQEPPRKTRYEPDAGPVGFTTGLPVG